VLQAKADVDGALALMDKAVTLARSSNATMRTVADVGANQVRLWLARGHLAEATRWAREFSLRLESGSERTAKAPIWHEMLQIALARVLIKQGRTAEALTLLARLLPAAEAGQRAGHMIEILA